MLPLLLNDAANCSHNSFRLMISIKNRDIDAKQEKKMKSTLTLEEVRAVLADKSRAGHTAEIRELLKKVRCKQVVTRRPETL